MSTTAATFQIGQTYRRAEHGARAFIVTARDGLRIRARDVADGWYFTVRADDPRAYARA